MTDRNRTTELWAFWCEPVYWSISLVYALVCW